MYRPENEPRGVWARMATGRYSVWSTRPDEPAVPISMDRSRGVQALGENVNSQAPTALPVTVAAPSSAADSTAFWCWGRRPGLSRLARILTMRNGRPVNSASVNAVRRIWPPPSPRDPSSTI